MKDIGISQRKRTRGKDLVGPQKNVAILLESPHSP
jgi:hypothetical protein